MPTERTILVYKFSELSEKAKNRAHYNWLCSHNNLWESENHDSLSAFCDTFPVEASNWNYDGYTGHIKMRMTTDYDSLDILSGVRLRTLLLNSYYNQLYAPVTKYYTKDANGKRRFNSVGNKTFTYTSKINFERRSCPFTGYCMDDALMDPIHAFIKDPKPDVKFEDLMQECGESWLKACIADRNYSESMEFFEEDVECNEYEFYENGKRA